MDNIRPDYLNVRHTLHLDTNAPLDVVQPALDKAQRNSPNLDVFSVAQPVSGQASFGPRPQV